MTGPPRVGFLGSGNVLPAYLQVLDRLVARGRARPGPVHARSPRGRDAVRARRPAAVVTHDVDEVLELSDIVCVLTPPHPRPQLVAQALETGCHVVAEKPLALTRADAEPLVELAAARGRHLLAAPFVQLSPTFGELWAVVHDGRIGRIHAARGLYGNAGVTWSPWYHTGGVGPLAETGSYNLKSLVHLLGPIAAVLAAEVVAVPRRDLDDVALDHPDPDTAQVLLRHASGTLSTLLASQAVQRSDVHGLELYGTEGTVNLLGDDWDPKGIELWRNATGTWERREAPDATWLWADGLRECVEAVIGARPPRASLPVDLHVLEVIDAARVSAVEERWVEVTSRPAPLDLRPAALDLRPAARATRHTHDRTRPVDEQ